MGAIYMEEDGILIYSLSQYEIDSELCVVKTYLHYVQRTVELGQDPRLFIKSQKPYSWVSRATLSHWIEDTLALSAIDMACFSTHSTSAASCSKAVTSNVPIDTVSCVLQVGNGIMCLEKLS